MSLQATLMQPLRQKFQQDLTRFELRRSQYGIYDTAVRNIGKLLNPETIAAIKRSFGNSITIPVLNARNVTIGNVRTCTIGDDENTTALLTLTFVTYAFGFTMYPAQYFNNDLGYQQDFNWKLEQYLLKFAQTLDTSGYNVINAARNKVWNTDTTNQYTVTANALQVPLAAQDNFYNVAAAIMNSMDFYGNNDVIASTFHRPLVSKFINQGGGNAENLAFQFPGFDFAYSNRIPNGTGVVSTAFIMPDGCFAMENRNDPDSIMGSKSTDGVEWSEEVLPILNLKVGSTYKSRCVDGNAAISTSGMSTATLREEFMWHTDVCWITPYNSDPTTRPGPIVKAEFLNA